ncbi:hypothetical protein NC653_000505 [Populus alba x Populus x berolinensis]|uniref:Uncharacterized protein n=1 Tax=Populus alba x Populus x berolinensis TaxID=444605 RepID=A0AAD6RJF6_9ROSI|nr:hypothetical protein NC653_000505 [Populus alba x Populus x berolinensis]
MEILSGLHEEKLGLIISKKFKTILVSCLIFLPATLLVLWMRHSTFDLVVEFSESNVQGKVHNVTEIDVGSRNDTCQSTSLAYDKLLNGLLAPGFEEASCLSRRCIHVLDKTNREEHQHFSSSLPLSTASRSSSRRKAQAPSPPALAAISSSHSLLHAATLTMATDQRKRTMDALERRFAVAKAELVQQQQKKHKVTHHEGHRKENNNAASTSLHRADAPKTTSSSLSKKGSSFFFGYTPSQDPDENGLAYSQLPQAVHENLLTTGAKFESKKGSVVDKILHELFQHGDASQKYMQGSRNIKIDNWILLDNYVPSKTTGSQTRASQSNPKHSRRHMSMKQRKKLGMFNLPQDLQKFDVYKPMHEIWKDYMMQLLKKTGRNELPKCLLSADLHGAAILVADCKIKSFTGISGIMICETAETFGIITQDNKLKVVPKKLSQCLGTNSLQETQSCDLHIAHFISVNGDDMLIASTWPTFVCGSRSEEY